MSKRFTFCWSGKELEGAFHRRVFRTARPGDLRVRTPKGMYALLFPTTMRSFRAIAEHPQVHQLFGYPLFGHEYKNRDKKHRLLVSAYPYSPPFVWTEAAKGSAILVYDADGNVAASVASDLYDSCMRPEKFSLYCGRCKIQERATNQHAYTHHLCVEHCMREAIRRGKLNSVNLERKVGPYSDNFDPIELHRHFLQYDTLGEFVYADPVHMIDDPLGVPREKVGKLYVVGELDPDHVVGNEIKLHTRSKNAAASRKAHKICDALCWLAKKCDWQDRSGYHSKARTCQEEHTTDLRYFKKRADLCGPFTEERILAMYERIWEKTQHRSREEISFIANNAGTMVSPYGRKMVLRSMDANLQNVVFTIPYVCQYQFFHRVFTFEAACELLRLPRRVKGGYEKNYIVETDYSNMLSFEQLALYMELCQHRAVRVNRGRNCRERYIDTFRRFGSVFEIQPQNYWSKIPASDLRSAVRIFGLQETIHDIDITSEGEVVTAHRGSTRDKLL